MTWTAGPVYACALVIGLAGMAKLARPSGTVQALRDARLPGLRRAGEPVAMAVGVVEIVVAAAAIAWGDRLTVALVVVAQVAFAAFALRLLAARGGARTCGCFGGSEAPVHPVHVWLNLALAAAAGVGVVRPPGSIGQVADHPAEAAVLAALVLVASWAIFLAFTALPEVLVAAARVNPREARA